MWMLDTPNPFTPRSEMLAFLQECERIKDHDPHGKRWKGAGIPGPTGPKGSGGKTGDLRDQDGSVGYGPLGGRLAEQEMTSAVRPSRSSEQPSKRSIGRPAGTTSISAAAVTTMRPTR